MSELARKKGRKNDRRKDKKKRKLVAGEIWKSI